MKWYALIFWFGWVVPSLVAFLRLFFDRERGTIKEYFSYCWWSIVPLWNLVFLYFVFKEVKDWVAAGLQSMNLEIVKSELHFAFKVWLCILGAVGLLGLIFKLSNL